MGIHKKVMKVFKSILLGLVSMATASRVARAGHGDHGDGEHLEEMVGQHNDTNSTMGGNMTDYYESSTHLPKPDEGYGEEVAEPGTEHDEMGEHGPYDEHHDDDHYKEEGHHNDHQDWEYMDNYWDEIASGALATTFTVGAALYGLL